MNKKSYVSILGVISMLTLFFVVHAIYADRADTRFGVNTVPIFIDGAPLETNNMIYGGKVYAPLEEASRQLGGVLQIDAEKHIIEISNGSGQDRNDSPKLPEGKQAADIQKSQYNIRFNHMDTYLEPIQYKEAIYVPIRYLSEFFNKKIEWNNEKRTVTVRNLDAGNIGSVNGIQITRREFNKYFNKAYEGLKEGGSEDLEKETAELKKQIFDNLVNIKILDAKAAENKIVLENADYDGINNSLKQIVDSYKGIDNFRKVLVKYDVYFSEVALDQERNVIYGKLWDEYTKNISVDEETIKKFYDDNKATMFTKPESVKVKQIVFNTTDKTGHPMSPEEKEKVKKKAQEILERIKSGEDFDKLMETYSDEGSSPEGEEIPKGVMSKKYEEAVFALKVGEISGVVESDFAYHIIKAMEKLPEKQATYEEVKNNIRANLEQQEKSSYYSKLQEQWKKESKIENLIAGGE